MTERPTLASFWTDLPREAWQGASAVGPVVAGVLIGHRWGGAYIVMLVGGLALVAWLALLAERRLPPHVNGVREPDRRPAEFPGRG